MAKGVVSCDVVGRKLVELLPCLHIEGERESGAEGRLAIRACPDNADVPADSDGVAEPISRDTIGGGEFSDLLPLPQQPVLPRVPRTQ